MVSVLEWYVGISDYNQLFNGEGHDIVVAESSQKGGVDMFEAFATSSFDNISHVGSYNKVEVQDTIKAILLASNDSNLLTEEGFKPDSLQYNSPVINEQDQNISLIFNSPSNNQVVNYGESILININSDDSPERIGLIIDELLMDDESLQIFESNPAEYTYQVTPRALGKIKLSAIAREEGVGTGFEKIQINVTTNEIPESIKPLGNSVVRVGKTTMANFDGYFSQFGKVSVSRAANAEFIFKNGYAEHIGEGVIQGIQVGTDTLRVIFNGVESEPMRILILDEDDITSTNFLSKPQSKVGSFDIFPNPSKGQITIKFDSSRLQEHTISIFDARGRVANTVNHSANAGENLVNLNLSNLPSGLYLMRIKGKDQNLIQRFIKS